MKNNFVAALLVVALGVSVLSAAILTTFFNRHTARVRQLQARLAEIQNTQNILQAIANDALVYSQRNPAMTPILQQFGLIGGAPAPASPAVAAPKNDSKSAPKKSR